MCHLGFSVRFRMAERGETAALADGTGGLDSVDTGEPVGSVSVHPPSTVDRSAAATRARSLTVSWPWATAATASVIALAVFAPSGLHLLAFLGVIIVTHEAGHLLMARRVGMRPTEFFWGFGPDVASFSVGGCRYGLKALFLGGYVRIEGMTPNSELPPGFDESATYRAASHRARLATILAGPAVNLASAFLAFTLASVANGAGPGRAAVEAARTTWLVISATGQALWVLVANVGAYVSAVLDTSGSTEAPVRFLSPVAQASISSQAVDMGVGASLQWFGILCCAIGAINLVPLPPLDGAHGVVAAAEGLAQRIYGDRTISFDVSRLIPLAYVTIGALVALSMTALVLDLRALT